MGDCRVRIAIAKQLLSKEQVEEFCPDPSQTLFSTANTFSSDTTIREVVEKNKVLWGLYAQQSKVGSTSFQLWDCTYNPPKNISSWPLEEFPELSGPKSKTLHDAGCFPSGTWLALPDGMAPGQFSGSNYEDAQYNQHEQVSSANPKGKVEFTQAALAAAGTSNPLPSQVMASVKRRFEEEDKRRDDDTQRARIARQKNKEEEKKRRNERAAKLDKRIQQLEEASTKKNKKVSDQVRRMLVKSRATGDKRLKQQDRLYYECLLDKGDEQLVREFRFFSGQDTFAKIAESFGAPNQANGLCNTEVLIKKVASGVDTSEYRRFPVAMRVYEAISEKFLTGDQVDVLVIRWFAKSEDTSPSILESLDQDADKHQKGDGNDMESSEEPTNSTSESQDVEMNTGSDSLLIDKELWSAIEKLDQAKNKGKKPKKASAAAQKVRMMQMKSKAIGDSKRVPKVEDRFFLEVVVIDESHNDANSSFRFLARTDPLERLLQQVAPETTPVDWQFLVPLEEPSSYTKVVDTTTTLKDAESNKIINAFGRIIMRRKK